MGDFEELDKSTLPGLGPIRIRVACKDPKEIKGSSVVFFNKRGSKFPGWWSQKIQESKLSSKENSENRKEDDEEEEEDVSDNYNPIFEESGNQNSKNSGLPSESRKQGEERQANTEAK